jgi:hypothetical protein
MNINELDPERKEYQTSDQGFAAYLATKFMFLDAIDTGEPMGKGKYGTRKAFLFLVPAEADMSLYLFEYEQGQDSSMVPAKVMFSKMRLMRQACQQPFYRDSIRSGAINGGQPKS